jgi:hypothetical protein
MQRWELHLTLEQIFPVVSMRHAEIATPATKIKFFLVGMEPCRCASSPMNSRIHIDTSGREVPMIVSPTKEDVRWWLLQRRGADCAPPDVKTIRRQLGWELVQEERREPRRDDRGSRGRK